MKLSAIFVCFAAVFVINANAQFLPGLGLGLGLGPLGLGPLGLGGLGGLGLPFMGGLGMPFLGRPFLGGGLLGRRLLLGKRDVDLQSGVETPIKEETLEVVPEKETIDEVKVPEVVPEKETIDEVKVPEVVVKPDTVQVVSEKPIVEIPGVPTVEFPQVPEFDVKPDNVQLIQVPVQSNKPENVSVVLKPTKTSCAISSVSRVLKCEGVSLEENFECEVIPFVHHLKDLKLRLADLTIRPVVNETTPVFELLSKKSSSKFTFVNPVDHKKEFLNIFMEQTVDKPGFLVRDRLCYAQFVSLLSFIPIEQVKFTVFIN